MRYIFITAALLLTCVESFSTGQEGDIIYWNNKRYSLLSNPLQSYPQFDSIQKIMFGGKPAVWESTSCYRGYKAEWKIIEDELYLTNIYSCYDTTRRANLSQLFKDRIENGRVKASWVNAVLIVPEGKLIWYGNIGYAYIFETEYELNIAGGKLTGHKKFDNSHYHVSVFTQEPDSLMKLIDRTINWSIIPDTLKTSVKVILILESSDTSKPAIRILKKSGIKLYDDEALRVANQIPDWDYYVQRGKIFKIPWMVPIVFSSEKKALFESRQ